MRVRIYRSRASSPPLFSVVELLPPKNFKSLTAETASAVAIGELEASKNVQGPHLQAVSINRALDGVPLGHLFRCLLQQKNQLEHPIMLVLCLPIRSAGVSSCAAQR